MTKVLLLDDSPFVLEMTRRMLEAHGFVVTTLSSPLLLADTVFDERPDIILMDVNMPGLSGDKVLRASRSHEWFRNIPKVFYSDRSADELQQLVNSTGADGYINKTSDGELIATRIKAFIAEHAKTKGE